MGRFPLFGVALILIATVSAQAQPALPIVDEVEWGSLRQNCLDLLSSRDKTGLVLPEKTMRDLRALVERKPDDTEAACRAVQNLLDAQCLLAVDINAESRVKAARGPAAATLRRNQPTVLLIKIHNAGGVTHALRLRGPEMVREAERGEGRWLRATLRTEAPFAPQLSGQRLEYRLLRLTSTQSGKREATFQLDVGQGTQDLGFRAEVPILFTIHDAKRD